MKTSICKALYFLKSCPFFDRGNCSTKNKFLWKSATFHSSKLPFDCGSCWKILKWYLMISTLKTNIYNYNMNVQISGIVRLFIYTSWKLHNRNCHSPDTRHLGLWVNQLCLVFLTRRIKKKHLVSRCSFITLKFIWQDTNRFAGKLVFDKQIKKQVIRFLGTSTPFYIYSQMLK